MKCDQSLEGRDSCLDASSFYLENYITWTHHFTFTTVPDSRHSDNIVHSFSRTNSQQSVIRMVNLLLPADEMIIKSSL